MEYFHSVTLNKDNCKGCTNCIKYCPTEAIRVKDGKAKIINERCIDCGECIRRCPYQAKKAVTDSLDLLDNFAFKIAIPAPAFYGQFNNVTINRILNSLYSLGFDYVYEVARGAELVSEIVKEELASGNLKKPVISSACPAVVRLIQVRFPDLLGHVLRIDSPMELAASLAKQKISQEKNIPLEKIGVFFISPCAAKVTSVKSPLGRKKSRVDGVFSIADIFGKVYNNLRKIDEEKDLQCASGIGIGWAVSGGEALALNIEDYLAVDGSEQVIKVLEQIEMGRLAHIEFFEGQACVGGCVGGPLTVENSFIARKRIRHLVNKMDKESKEIKKGITPELWQKIKEEAHWTEMINPREIMKLDEDRVRALEKINLLEKIYKSLPGLDCGACGAPTCRALAEDIVRGWGNEYDCIFRLREELKNLALHLIQRTNGK